MGYLTLFKMMNQQIRPFASGLAKSVFILLMVAASAAAQSAAPDTTPTPLPTIPPLPQTPPLDPPHGWRPVPTPPPGATPTPLPTPTLPGGNDPGANGGNRTLKTAAGFASISGTFTEPSFGGAWKDKTTGKLVEDPEAPGTNVVNPQDNKPTLYFGLEHP